jgi:hypothetical protein
MTSAGGRALRRKSASRKPKNIVYVLCEGGVTEPDYLREFVRHVDPDKRKVLKVLGGKGVPYTVVQECVALRKELRSKNRHSMASGDQIWAVFDVDEHLRLTEAAEFARVHDVKLAISNPCIELWGLLHAGEVDAPLTRQEAQRKLRDIMPGYDHRKNPVFPWSYCVDKFEAAMRNAVRGRKNREAEGSRFPNDSPSSSFDLLLAEFI